MSSVLVAMELDDATRYAEEMEADAGARPRVEAAFRLGKGARRRGVPLADAPELEGRQERAAWIDGWILECWNPSRDGEGYEP